MLSVDSGHGRIGTGGPLAFGRRSLIIFLIGLAIGIIVGYLVLTLRQKLKPKFFAMTEYWIYIPGERLPKQDDVMSLVLQGNSPVGPEEGLLFSDIRLHIALVLRTKNPHVFRPDLFDEHIEPTADLLQRMASSNAVAKIRYASEERLNSDAHLQLLPYLAYAYSKLADGVAVFDVAAEKVMSIEEFRELLRDRNARRVDMHVNTIWHRSEDGGRAETRGLVKKGIPELVTAQVHADERLLVTGLVDEAAKQIWEASEFPSQVEVESYNDLFRLLLAAPKEGKSEVRIMRVQSS